jgi:hypothetical protein
MNRAEAREPIQRGQSSKAMKEKVWHNWRMEENCLRVRLIRVPASIKRSAGGRLMEMSP